MASSMRSPLYRIAPVAWCLVLILALTGACTSSTGPRSPLGVWTPLPQGPAPRVGHAAVWTGRQMVMWGGQMVQGAKYRSDGEIFEPASHRWSQIPDAPLEARSDEVAAWTGSRLLVWGGGIEGPKRHAKSFSDGASYDAATGRWTPMAPAPIEPRILHTGVWTGSRF